MLVRFLLKNWMSYKDEAELSLIATGEKQHVETLANIKKFRLKLLPVTAIYGPNASGKSNLVAGIGFAREFILKGLGVNDSIPVRRFKLDDDGLKAPLEMQFDLLINELIYKFKFAVTAKAVVSESLTVTNSSSEKVLYTRTGQDIKLGETIKDRDGKWRFSTQTTRENTLFLTNTVLQNFKEFRPVYDWFNETLVIVTPSSQYGLVSRFIDKSDPISQKVSELLSDFDTGVERLVGQPIDVKMLPISAEDLNTIQTQLADGEKVTLRSPTMASMFVISKVGDELQAMKVVANHRKSDGTEVSFSLDEESDGTNRLIDMAPSLLMLCQDKSRVIIIDELDRSLHTKVTQEYVNRFLNVCDESRRNQLIFTTHDVSLMGQHMLRRDELWLTERDSLGASQLTAFCEYKDVRKDNNLILSYLSGRVGGLPNISGVFGSCSNGGYSVQIKTFS